MKSRKKIIFSIILIGTLGNLTYVFRIKQKTIRELKIENNLIKSKEVLYEESLKLIFNKNSICLPLDLNYQYVIYFPSQACSICLEDLLLLIDSKEESQEKALIYLTDSVNGSIVERFNDMFGTKYTYMIGEALFYEDRTEICLLNINEGLVAGVLLLDSESIIDYKTLLNTFKEIKCSLK